MEGKIVVDGVLASCYASCNHDLAHLGMTPIGSFPYIIELIFGNENGSLTYVNVVGDVGKIVGSTSVSVQQRVIYQLRSHI